jgi:hypothetical protein
MKKLLILVAVFVMAMSVAQATTILVDDFEGYANQAALDAADQPGGWISVVALDPAGHVGNCLSLTYADTGGAPWYGSDKFGVVPAINANAMTNITYWAKTTAPSTNLQLNFMTLNPADLPLDYSQSGATFDPLFNAAGVGASKNISPVTGTAWKFYHTPLSAFDVNAYAFGHGGDWAVTVTWAAVDTVEYQVGGGSGIFSIDDVKFADIIASPTPIPCPTPTPTPTPYGANLLVNGDFAAGLQAPWIDKEVHASDTPPTIDYAYSTDGPNGGTAPCLSWSAVTDGWGDNTGHAIYQPVTLMAGCTYKTSLLYKDTHSGDGFWCELYMTSVEPTVGVDVVTNTHTKQLLAKGSWAGGGNNYNGVVVSDPLHPYVAPAAGTFYFVMKLGRLGPGGDQLLLDNVNLQRQLNVVPVELLDFSAE